MYDSMIVYRSFYEAIKELDDVTAAAVFRAMCEYGLNGTEVKLSGVSRAIFALIKPQIDANNKRKENGFKGGRPKTKQNQSETKAKPNNNQNETETEANINVNVNVNDNVNVVKKKDANASKKEMRHKYGQYDNVLLSDTEFEKLKSEFPNDYTERIERLSEYMASTGKSYKSHLATIRVWARKDRTQTPQKAPQSAQRGSAEDLQNFYQRSINWAQGG